jgi:hypothetical protein
MAKGRTKKPQIELKYSLLIPKFQSTIGKTLSQKLKDSIASWKEKKDDKTADELVALYIQSLVSYWKKTKCKDFKDYDVGKDFNLIVDLVYKKGRKPNSIRLDNNPGLKRELSALLK